MVIKGSDYMLVTYRKNIILAALYATKKPGDIYVPYFFFFFSKSREGW
jgi:hypothetical protein